MCRDFSLVDRVLYVHWKHKIIVRHVTKNVDVSYKYWNIDFLDLSDKLQIRDENSINQRHRAIYINADVMWRFWTKETHDCRDVVSWAKDEFRVNRNWDVWLY